MSVEEAGGESEAENQEQELFGQLPAEVSGWVKHSRRSEDTLFEYWKKGSTHINGAYEQITANQLSDGNIRVTNCVYDQFNHLLNTRTLTERPPEDAAHLWRVARDRMDEFPGNEPFDSPPSIPEAIGDWELMSEAHEDPLEVTTWWRPFGAAELLVEQTDVIAHYSHTKRPHQIRYREPDTDAQVVVEEVPRTSAFEIAENSLRALTARLSELRAQQEELKSVKGVGPAKSRQFLLLGITSPEEVKAYLEAESPGVNHHHREAIEKLLTVNIREHFL